MPRLLKTVGELHPPLPPLAAIYLCPETSMADKNLKNPMAAGLEVFW